MQPITCVDDLREIARHRVPRMFFDYAESGSYAEETLAANRRDLKAILFRQKILVDVSKRTTDTKVLGKPLSLPLVLAPVGLCGMQRGNGEILAAKAAAKAGIPFCLSTMSVCSIEDVAEEASEPFWFQLYVMKDRGFIERLIDRAKAANCSARSRGICSLAAINRPSTETSTACDTPGTSRAKLDTSQSSELFCARGG